MGIELPLVTFEREDDRVTARPSTLSARTPAGQAEIHAEAIPAEVTEYESTIHATLQRAGFVPVGGPGGPHHRLPLGMTDPVEQRLTTTLACDMLQVEGVEIRCARELFNPEQSVGYSEWGVADGLGRLGKHVEEAEHTRDVVAALSELTAPGDGILRRVSDVLDATAVRCDELATPADRQHAAQLRFLAAALTSHTQEISDVRHALADRHAALPVKAVEQRGTVPETNPSARVEAALSVSPHAPRGTAAPLATSPSLAPSPRPTNPRR